VAEAAVECMHGAVDSIKNTSEYSAKGEVSK